MGRKEVQMKSLSDLSPPVYFLTYAMILGEIDWTLVFIVIGKKGHKHVSYIRFSRIVKHFFQVKVKRTLNKCDSCHTS